MDKRTILVVDDELGIRGLLSEYGIVLRLGVQNRYDSDPGLAKRNDLTYFATLGFGF